MYKIITFPKTRGYEICTRILANENFAMTSLIQCNSVGCFFIKDEELDAFSKLMGRAGYLVSEQVKVMLHSQEIPWGVEHMGAPALWDVTKGAGVKVAVIDTGISSSHPDLKGRVKAQKIINKESGSGRQSSGHGTHVAGTIAAVYNDSGIVGIAPEVELYDVQAFGAEGTANMSDIIEGINWAIEQDVDIINMSFGTPEYHHALHQAIRAAKRAGIVLVASAGNSGGALEYPGAYKEVTAVGAINQEARLADFSSRGKGMNTVAPGVEIKSTWGNRGYKVLNGTSMAAAHISGLYALQIAKRKRGRRSRVSRIANL
ncbi:S8 family peptidase [Brevibacillus daliensis]|uniref:S8 family peptidase n=1 Tax=Brevibacillus daliensis TaxID=2892995 RepID=UPI001E549925|nr:S8 family peptidase [Brevibacillus daliensis]